MTSEFPDLGETTSIILPDSSSDVTSPQYAQKMVEFLSRQRAHFPRDAPSVTRNVPLRGALTSLSPSLLGRSPALQVQQTSPPVSAPETATSSAFPSCSESLRLSHSALRAPHAGNAAHGAAHTSQVPSVACVRRSRYCNLATHSLHGQPCPRFSSQTPAAQTRPLSSRELCCEATLPLPCCWLWVFWGQKCWPLCSCLY